jgi:hypothetical protein
MGSESEKSNQNSQPQDPTSSELYIQWLPLRFTHLAAEQNLEYSFRVNSFSKETEYSSTVYKYTHTLHTSTYYRLRMIRFPNEWQNTNVTVAQNAKTNETAVTTYRIGSESSATFPTVPFRTTGPELEVHDLRLSFPL